MPRYLNIREERAWRLRFDPDHLHTIAQLEVDFGIDRSYLRSGARKLSWNLDHGFDPKQTRELIALAVRVMKVEVENNQYLVYELLTRRAQQGHESRWERHCQQYLKK